MWIGLVHALLDRRLRREVVRGTAPGLVDHGFTRQRLLADSRAGRAIAGQPEYIRLFCSCRSQVLMGDNGQQ